MIINQNDLSIVRGGIRYPIGGKIMVKPEHPYAGLYGTIMEIRTREDAQSIGASEEIVCKLMAPVLPDEIAAFEKQFSQLCGKKMAMEDIPLNAVILHPSQIQILFQEENTVDMPVYILREDWAMDGDYGMTMFITADHDEARWEMQEMVHKDMKEGILSRLLDRSDLDTDHGEDHYKCWRNGCYSDDHYLADIEQANIKIPAVFAPYFGIKAK